MFSNLPKPSSYFIFNNMVIKNNNVKHITTIQNDFETSYN